jgi:hypothetical protein
MAASRETEPLSAHFPLPQSHWPVCLHTGCTNRIGSRICCAVLVCIAGISSNGTALLRQERSAFAAGVRKSSCLGGPRATERSSCSNRHVPVTNRTSTAGAGTHHEPAARLAHLLVHSSKTFDRPCLAKETVGEGRNRGGCHQRWPRMRSHPSFTKVPLTSAGEKGNIVGLQAEW